MFRGIFNALRGINVGQLGRRALHVGRQTLDGYQNIRGKIDTALDTAKKVKGALESNDQGKLLIAGVEKLMNSHPAGTRLQEGLHKASDILKQTDTHAHNIAGKMKEVEARLGLSPADQAKMLAKQESAAPEPPTPADNLVERMA